MKSATNLKVDIAHSGFVSPVEAVQGDGGLRSISVELMDRGKPWYPPAGTEIAVVYTHSDGTKGLYNKLPDGRKAVTLRNNIVTAVLAPQMLAAAGQVKAAIVFSNDQLDQLTTFPITITVKENLFAGAEETEDYIRLQWLEDKLEEYVRNLKASGAFDGAPGPQGQKGDPGKDGAPGRDGVDGKDGAPGHTPEYGVDYGTPEQIAGIAQQAADILQPEVDQIKDNLSDKLPKSPASWEPWTAEEQAAALEKFGGAAAGWKESQVIEITEDVVRLDINFDDSPSLNEIAIIVDGIGTGVASKYKIAIYHTYAFEWLHWNDNKFTFSNNYTTYVYLKRFGNYWKSESINPRIATEYATTPSVKIVPYGRRQPVNATDIQYIRLSEYDLGIGSKVYVLTR